MREDGAQHPRDDSQHQQHSREHDGDEPAGTGFSLGRRLRDAEGVDEYADEEAKRIHGDWTPELDREVRNSAVCTDSAASRKVCVSSHSVCQNILPRPDWSYILEM